jgi:hypothetical protein
VIDTGYPETIHRVWGRLFAESDELTVGELRSLLADLPDDTPIMSNHAQDDTYHRVRRVDYWICDEGTDKQDGHVCIQVAYGEKPVGYCHCLCCLRDRENWQEPIHADEDAA